MSDEKPKSLTVERCLACMPTLEVCPEWMAKEKAGLNPKGMLGAAGMLRTVPPKEQFTKEEAAYVASLEETCSMRYLAFELVQDDNQCHGMLLLEAAKSVLAAK